MWVSLIVSFLTFIASIIVIVGILKVSMPIEFISTSNCQIIACILQRKKPTYFYSMKLKSKPLYIYRGSDPR